MTENTQTFWRTAGRILNAGQTRTLLLTGNIHDLFPRARGVEIKDYVPLVDLLVDTWSVPDLILVVYELNGPIRFARTEDRERVKEHWLKWRTGLDSDDLAIKKMLATGKDRAEIEMLSRTFDDNLKKAVGNPTIAFELLRQMCLCSRTVVDGRPIIPADLIIFVEAADMAIPAGEITRLSDMDRHRISICQDWFSDPGFMDGGDSVILVAESRSMINQRIANMPQILSLEVPSPGEGERLNYIEWFDRRQPEDGRIKTWGSKEDLARFTAGLSIHALRQLLIGACYQDTTLSRDTVIEKVESFIQSQLGEDIVEFKKPSHRLEDLVGFTDLKVFLREDLIPRFQSTGPGALPGAAVCGPIGGGKTFIFEALGAELNMVVLVLKNIRSQWFGQTDVVFERLRRVLVALSSVMIFVDEADTQFGGVGPGAHATERRLTGKVQAMMSDSRLRGKVFWLLMTARIHLLSPDIRRPGRVGDLIIPVLDPVGKDKDAFLQWMVEPVLKRPLNEQELQSLAAATEGYFAAAYASLRSEMIARGRRGELTMEGVVSIIQDHLAPAIGKTRRYQTLQALLNCTRRSLLPNPNLSDEDREEWSRELRELERQGIG